MDEFERLSGATSWIDLDFVERERTPREIVEVGIQLHVAELSLSNTKQIFEQLGVERSRTAIHNWVQKADLQPSCDGSPNHVGVDETVMQVDDERHWLFAAVDPETNEILHARLFQTRTTQLTVLFLRDLREQQHVEQATFLVDGATHSASALDRLGLGFQTVRHGNRNGVERVLREVKRRTSSFSNTFSNASLASAESWSRVFAVWRNRCQTYSSHQRYLLTWFVDRHSILYRTPSKLFPEQTVLMTTITRRTSSPRIGKKVQGPDWVGSPASIS